ncbi:MULTISPECIES: ROK family protein [Enterococcus]|uniref:Sugar kinase n=1 Tax=Enterococcus thailandicus TaxID=417368 RepID=A0A179EUF7_ENTTH|nr:MULTISPECIES: ROK family protein [Enterococcus]ASZ08082.1 ROK family protein [Enterococcus thailandicus]MDA3964236.1 ROK family protein [Enterococcus thailandicus]MDK4353099.1 ROK family protein [Enterococcus thailandicus]MDT2734156.1 ROK family protein [Enterococcus thailandicus]MDT2752249.1 ROK family protein [Enterococcus thailandicus]
MYVGFDIGGTTVKYGVLDEVGNILEKSAIPTNYQLADFLVELDTIVKDAQKRYEKIEGIGISAPGIIQEDGYMLTAGAIRPFYGANIKIELERLTGLPVSIENDANAAAIAEHWIGNAQGLENYLCIVLGTGIGGGIVLNGEVFRGAHGMAGEFGWSIIDHLPAEGDIEEVSWNKRAATVGGLCYQYNLSQKKLDAAAPMILDAREIFQREAEGEVLAINIVEQFLTDLSVGMLNLISFFDPELILFGGGISSNEEFNQRFQKRLEEVMNRHESIHYLKNKTIAAVRPAKLQNDAGMIGAVYQIHRQVTK